MTRDFPYLQRNEGALTVGRLAPSPTGAQHLGNARTFLFAWLSVRQHQGHLLLRIEDLDTPRTKFGADQQAMEDLRWLGLDWDEGPDAIAAEGTFLPKVQSQRLPRYAEVFQQILLQELVYPCTCTRKDIEEAQSAPHERASLSSESWIGEIRYSGTCANHVVADAEVFAREGRPFAWRFRMPDRVVRWLDGFAGWQECNPQQVLGDFVIARMNGAPAYQFAVVVDDHDMHVTEIVRGDDLVPSTYRQLAIYEALGWRPPSMVHVPLVVGPDGRRLAKRHGDTRLATLREAGIRPETLWGFFAWCHGWIDAYRPFTAQQLLGIADLSSIPKTPLRFEELDAIQYFRQLQKDVS